MYIYMYGIIIQLLNNSFSLFQKMQSLLLLLLGKALLSLKPLVGVGAMWHAGVLWVETLHVFLRTLTAQC